MSKKFRQSFFTQNGKALNRIKPKKNRFVHFASESISSLVSTAEKIDSLVYEAFIESPQKPELTFTNVFIYKLHNLKKWLSSKNVKSHKIGHALLSKHAWVTGSLAAFVFGALVIILYPMKVLPSISDKYSIYASTPLQYGSATYQIYSKDARAQKINLVFREYNCPLEGMGEIFVYEADKHNIPWWLVAAVSFQESSCGKKTPEPEGVESYNAWGWAVYGENVHSFDNWARGVEVVSEYMSEKFFSKGITEPCDLMKTYTPPSKGSWCEGVNHFGDLIQNYTSDST